MMMELWIGVIVIATAVFIIPMNSSAAGGYGKKKSKKVGILLVAFGSSEPSTQTSYQAIERKVKIKYPTIPVRWAYTSHMIRTKLAQKGKILDSPEVAITKMHDENFTHVAVQSLHIIGGDEYHDLIRTVGASKMLGGFQRIVLGYPLLATQEDMQRTVSAVIETIPKERKKMTLWFSWATARITPQMLSTRLSCFSSN